MDLCSLRLQLVIWTLSFCLEISVRHPELKPCEANDRVCVTDLRDCRPPSPSQKVLNMSCYYQEDSDRIRSVSCSWSQESESEASLVFTSRLKVYSCLGIFNPAAELSVTARMRSYLTGSDVWSRPQTLRLFDSVRPPRPALTLASSTADSLVVSWESAVSGSCRLRQRPNNSLTWTEVSDRIPAHHSEELNYTIANLLPFTAYEVAAACRRPSGVWSDWSLVITVRTLNRVPSKPAEIFYRVEKTYSDGSLLLCLIWTASDVGRVLGYQVAVDPLNYTRNVTEMTLLLVVKEGNCVVTVRAFNPAGVGPATRLDVNTQTQIPLPSVTHLWVVSGYPDSNELRVQWTPPLAVSASPPGSHAVVQWRSEKRPSSSRWLRVNGSVSSAAITCEGVDPKDSYLVSVFTVYNQQCGPPRSLAASLLLGALLEAFDLKVASVTKTTVTVMWAWKPGTVRVDSYRVMLRRDSHAQTLSLRPDQTQHTFSSLTPSTQYSLVLLADNISRRIIPVATRLDEVPAVAMATPLLLLVVMVTTISILSRTLYKSYFFPQIANPERSSAGQWLLNPNIKKRGERSILDITDFQETDVLGEKHLILVFPKDQLPHQDKPLQPTSNLFVQLATVKPDSENVLDYRPITRQQLISLQALFTSEEVGGTDVSLLLNITESVHSLEDEDDVYPEPHQDRPALSFQLPEPPTDSLKQPETAAGSVEPSSLTYEVEYLTNGCFRAEAAAEDEIDGSLALM